jgi:ABC-2 type transport system permease protein
MKEINAILTIAYRDLAKFLRDTPRIIATFIFPFVFIGVLGGSLQSNLGQSAGFNLLLFVFTGVIGQTLFQSTASGIISLIEDKENDFSQEIFIAPVSRLSIIFGKILGESMVAFIQVLAIIGFGLIIGLPIGFFQIISILPVALIACLFGGAFGIIVLANLSSQRAANQIFPFVMFPQFFLSGVFSPIGHLPPVLFILSRIVPMTYAVDLIRGIFYLNQPEYSKVVLHPPLVNLGIIAIFFTIFLTFGTILFVRHERNR